MIEWFVIALVGWWFVARAIFYSLTRRNHFAWAPVAAFGTIGVGVTLGPPILALVGGLATAVSEATIQGGYEEKWLDSIRRRDSRHS